MMFWIGAGGVAAAVTAFGWWTSGRTKGQRAPGAEYDVMKAEIERDMVVRRMKGTGGVGGL